MSLWLPIHIVCSCHITVPPTTHDPHGYSTLVVPPPHLSNMEGGDPSTAVCVYNDSDYPRHVRSSSATQPSDRQVSLASNAIHALPAQPALHADVDGPDSGRTQTD